MAARLEALEKQVEGLAVEVRQAKAAAARANRAAKAAGQPAASDDE